MGGTSSLAKPNKRQSREEVQFYKFHTKAKALLSKEQTTAAYPTLHQEWNQLLTRNHIEVPDLSREANGRVLIIGSTTDFKKGEKPLLRCYEDMFTMSKFFSNGNYNCINSIGPLINDGKEVMTKDFCLKAITEEIDQLAASNYQHTIIYFSGQAKKGHGWYFKDGCVEFFEILEIWNKIFGGTQDKELAIIVDTNFAGEWCDEATKIYYPSKIAVISAIESGKQNSHGIFTQACTSYIQRDKEIFETLKKKKVVFQASLPPVFRIWHLQELLFFIDQNVNYHNRFECDDYKPKVQNPQANILVSPNVDQNMGQVEIIQQKVGNKNHITINAPDGTDITISENIVRATCPKGHSLDWTTEIFKCSGCYGQTNGFQCKQCQYFLGSECYKGKYDTKKCPNGHKLYWTATDKECTSCKTKSHGMQCIHCQFHLCSHCAKVAIRPDTCPNNHSLKWYSAPGKCLRCISYCSGMECKACGYRLCTDCSEVSLPKTNCINGHALHWTIKEHDCLECKQKLCGKMCPACDYFLCNRDADVKYERDKCPNKHALTTTLNESLCMICLRKAKGMRCIPCSYNVCSTCISEK